jgi:hypothetical protein
MKIYHYDRDIKVFTYESEARELKKDKGKFAIPAFASEKSPFDCGILEDKECYLFNEAVHVWEIVPDYRNFTYYDLTEKVMKVIINVNVLPPKEYATYAPPSSIYKPEWDASKKEWVETALLYKGFPVETKADVDAITNKCISSLGEDKAKTEKLLAGDNPCPIWDTFVATRQILIDEGNAFITANNLV